MSDPVSFFLNARKSVTQYETLELSHPSFSRDFYLVRARANLTATLETGEVVVFERIPMRIRRLASRADLDYGIGVDLGDLGELIPDEIDRARAAGTLGIKPTVISRVYRSDDLTSPMFGPIRLEAKDISMTRVGASFEAGAPSLNLTRTGERQTTDRFVMLRGLIY